MLLHGISTPSLVTLAAQQVVKALTGPVQVNGAWVELAATAGLALAGDHARDPDELLHRADMALYQAKGQPHALRLGTYTRTRGRVGLGAPTGTVAAALAVTGGQLQVGYEPIVDLATGQVTTAEAIPIWHHPEFGDLPPHAFLATAEQAGCLSELTDALLDQALRDTTAWHRAGHRINLAINISPRNLADPRFHEAVLARLAQAAVAPGYLVLELNRIHTINHRPSIQQAARALQQAGMALAVDVVGTAQAHPATVASLHPNQIKLDPRRGRRSHHHRPGRRSPIQLSRWQSASGPPSQPSALNEKISMTAFDGTAATSGKERCTAAPTPPTRCCISSAAKCRGRPPRTANQVHTRTPSRRQWPVIACHAFAAASRTDQPFKPSKPRDARGLFRIEGSSGFAGVIG